MTEAPGRVDQPARNLWIIFLFHFNRMIPSKLLSLLFHKDALLFVTGATIR